MGVLWSILAVVFFILGVIFILSICRMSGEADEREQELIRKMLDKKD